MRIIAFISLLALYSISSSAADIYVSSEKGNDKNSGKLESPLKSIQSAIIRMKTGDSVIIRKGIYRETLTITGKGTENAPLSIKPYENEKVTICGSDTVTGWELYKPGIWRKKDWKFNSQQLFVDGKILSQKGFSSDFYPPAASDGNWMLKADGSGIEDLTVNSFYYDRKEQILYIRLPENMNPDEHSVEASVRMYLVDALNSEFLKIKGLTFRHSNTSAHKQGGAAIELGDSSVLEDCDVQWCDFAGVSVGYKKQNTKIINCEISNNGNSGISATLHKNFTIKSCRISGNNYRNFNHTWHAGGIKCIPDSYGTIEDCVIGNNNAVGVWFDYCRTNQQSVVRNNKIFNNKAMGGIFLEVSWNVLVENNVFSGNELLGIRMSTTSNCIIQNNLIAETKGFIALDIEGPRPKIEDVMKNNKIINNVLLDNQTEFDVHIAVESKYMVNNICDYNTYIRKGGAKMRMTAGGKENWKSLLVTQNIEQWKSATGNDIHSISYDNSSSVSATVP